MWSAANRNRRSPAAPGVSARGAFVALSLIASLVTTLISPPAATAIWTVDSTVHTADQIRTMWGQLKPSYSGPAYAVAPSVKAPYAPGSIQPGFLADGLNTINFARYLAGLPYDVTLDPMKNEDAQYGAVLLAASTFAHEPPKPPDMSQAFYDRGLASTTSSNLGWGRSDSESFQMDCLDDSDPGNIAHLGHRRWLLNPRMKQTGIGYAEYRNVTYAFDYSRTEPVDYSAIAWPSAGLFPVEFFGAETAWSVTLDPTRYDWDTTGPSGSPPQTVRLRRISDGRTWVFTASDTNTSGEYFNAEFSGYGIGNAFVFRPDPSSIAYAPGNEFEVTLTGGIYVEGTKDPATITHRTVFMSLTPDTDLTSVYRFYNVKNGTHFYTPSAEERDTVISRWPETYSYEGVAYRLQPSANVQPLYRFYNLRNGSHFYTASPDEALRVWEQMSNIYQYEGETYKVNPPASAIGTPVCRFFNKRVGTHFYTADPAEKANVQAKLAHVYTYEGIAFYLGQ